MSETAEVPTIWNAAKAFAHPLRIAIYEKLLADAAADRKIERRKHKPEGWEPWTGTSPNELCKALDEPLTNVSYHVRMLHELGVIELVTTAPRRGALEHYYRATCDIRIGVTALNGAA